MDALAASAVGAISSGGGTAVDDVSVRCFLFGWTCSSSLLWEEEVDLESSSDIV